jgi:hypothetical protein
MLLRCAHTKTTYTQPRTDIRHPRHSPTGCRHGRFRGGGGGKRGVSRNWVDDGVKASALTGGLNLRLGYYCGEKERV